MATCQHCGQLIIGPALTALGGMWHPGHFLCAICNQPITDEFIPHEGRPYHHQCFAQNMLEPCTYCHKPLKGQYFKDVWGNSFCFEHKDELPLCNFCNRMIIPYQGQENDKGRELVRCQLCRQKAIETVEEARPHYARVTQWISQQGFRFNQLPLSLEICTRAKLRELAGPRYSPQMLGIALKRSSSTAHASWTDVRGIAILQGIPTVNFQGVVAHELGHVWLTVHGIIHAQLWEEEGFCEMLSHRYYQSLQTQEGNLLATRIESNPEPTYGEGFRRMFARVKPFGFPQFLMHIQQTKHL